MKSCEVYIIEKVIKIITKGESEYGYGIDIEPIILLDITSDSGILKDAIQESLQSCRSNITVPKSSSGWKEYQANLLKRLNEKSFRNLYKNSISFNVEIDGASMFIRRNKLYNPKRPDEGLVFDTEIMFENNSTGFQEMINYLQREIDRVL